MQCRQSKRTCSACDVSVLDLFPQEAGQNAVDEFHHLGGLVLTGDLHRLTDGHTVGDIRHIQELIEQLPENQRQVIRLRGIEDCSYEDIEQITGLSSSNIRTLLSRARKLIREKLEKASCHG